MRPQPPSASASVSWRRVAVTGGALIGVLVLVGVLRALTAHGVFTALHPGTDDRYAGVCRAVASAPGPEDIVIDRQSGIAIISSTDRRALKAGKPSPADGLYAYAYGVSGAKPVKIAGTSANFHPHGLSLYRGPGGSLTLFVINHAYKAKNAIVTYTVAVKDGVVHLTETGFITSGLLKSPNAIAAIDDTRFYVVNDHTVTSDGGRWADDNLLMPRADILYFNGTGLVRAVERLNFPNGAVVSEDGRFLYVSESYARKILAFERDPMMGQLKLAGELFVPSNLDNLRLGEDGALWVGSHPKAYALSDYRHDAGKPAPSVVYRITLQDGLPVQYQQILSDAGTQIGASSVADYAGGHLLIGSAYDTKILNCTGR